MFAELMDGMNALREEREGKRTLRTYVISSADSKRDAEGP